jgi:hypothetical protein
MRGAARSWGYGLAAFAVGLLAVGLPYWRTPYAQVSLPSTLYGPGLIAVALAAATARGVARLGLRAAVLAAGAAVPAAVLARVAVDTAADPTSHNLWPFELIIAAALGASCAAAGALVGSLRGLFPARR